MKTILSTVIAFAALMAVVAPSAEAECRERHVGTTRVYENVGFAFDVKMKNYLKVRWCENRQGELVRTKAWTDCSSPWFAPAPWTCRITLNSRNEVRMKTRQTFRCFTWVRFKKVCKTLIKLGTNGEEFVQRSDVKGSKLFCKNTTLVLVAGKVFKEIPFGVRRDCWRGGLGLKKVL
jgi:hypothetical protein